MKIARLLFLFVLLMSFFLQSVPAKPQKMSSAATYFQWHPGSKKNQTQIRTDNDFRLQQGGNTVSGPQSLNKTGEQLLLFLVESEQTLSGQYHLNPGNRHFNIPLIPVGSLQGSDHQFPIFSTENRVMVFPFPVDETATLKDPANRFALFNLLHAIIRANLAFGDKERLPVSSHAFRFIDGLSGHLALKIMEERTPANREWYLDILETGHHEREIARRFSATQLLAQNSNSEDTDILAGLNQFFSGIGLTRNSEIALNLPDGSSSADRIRVFQWIEAHHSQTTVVDIIRYLSRSSDIWTINEDSEDSFCRQYIRFGCRGKAIDGTRSDIILQKTTEMNFA